MPKTKPPIKYDYKFYRATKSIRADLKKFYITHADEKQKKMDYTDMLNGRGVVSKHQQYFLRQLEWVRNNLKGNNPLTAGIATALKEVPEFAERLNNNTADFQIKRGRTLFGGKPQPSDLGGTTATLQNTEALIWTNHNA